jgi:NADPH:quinone reductase-like Zn-dependent oxidoreductase
VPKAGQVLIKVKAFGLNRSELFTRQGHSPGIQFPRVLGLEAVGTVEEAPGNEFAKDTIVATAMGGMGRMYDGGYAEYCCVPANQVQTIKTKGLPWDVLGALPEMMQTVWGSLFKSLRLQKGDSLLIRGGTTSIGLAAAAIAKKHGAFVASTSRNAARESLLRENGADDFFVDNGSIAEEVKKRYPKGFSKILELVGISTMLDSLKCAEQHGIVCMTGLAGGVWTLDGFSPNGMIPISVCLTSYGSSVEDFMNTPLDEIAQQIQDGSLKIPIKTFKFEDIVAAHQHMDDSTAGAKMVVVIE